MRYQCLLQEQQYDNLRSMYSQLNGEKWVYTSNNSIKWNFSAIPKEADPCIEKWEGLRCSSDNLTIVTLILSFHNLQGQLENSTFQNLSSTLTHLDFSNNYLSGTIPNQLLTNFSKLAYIDMSGNDLSGELPSALYTLTLLENINLAHNLQLTGSLSSQISQLTCLRVLSFGHCSLYGSIPSAITKLTNLTTLVLEFNKKLTGELPRDIGHMIALEKLLLWTADIKGKVISLDITYATADFRI